MFSPADFKILVCDDSITNVMILSELCKSEGFSDVETVSDPRKVLPLMQEKEFDLLILDLEMPHLSGFEVMQQIRSHFGDDFLPILILTGLLGVDTRNRALTEGATDFLNKPFDQTEVILRVKNLIKIRSAYKLQKIHAQELEKKVQERTAELNRATETLILRLAKAGELRDSDTGKHVTRVGEYARMLAELMGLPQQISFMINKAAPLHDLGKIGISDRILLKPGKLTDDEWNIMKTHAELGADLLDEGDSYLLQLAASIAKTHHEKWDGSGYPAQLAGESIPIEGRITAISDVFDALTTTRPYKQSWDISDAVEFLKAESGKSFDPKLVTLFVDNLERVREIMHNFSDEDDVRNR